MFESSGTGNRSSSYVDVDTIYDIDDKSICAVISRHSASGKFSMALFKEYDRDGEMRKTSFIPPKYLSAVIRVASTAAARCEVLAQEAEAEAQKRRWRDAPSANRRRPA